MNMPLRRATRAIDIGRHAQARRLDAAQRPSERTRTVSCVIPCFNESDNLNALLSQLEEVLAGTGFEWEIIVVDDGSTDRTAEVAARWCTLSGFRCIALSRNFGKEAALTAGLQAARGDAVVLMDGDRQHSPALVKVMLDEWVRGAQVVHTVRRERRAETPAKRLGARLFYRLMNASHRFKLAEDAGDFRLMDRKVVNALLSLPERTRFMKGLYAWVGFRTVALPYTPEPRAAGQSSFGLLRLAGLAVDGLTAFTTWPLRMVSIVGVLLAAPALAYGLFLVMSHLLVGNTVSGWTTLAVSLMFFMGIQMIFTGVLGEYVARIFDEVKGRPLYVVDREWGEGLTADER